MARTKNPAPGAAHSVADTATGPGPAPVAPAASDSAAAAVLAALSAEPGGVAVAVIAEHAGISMAAARQALIAHETAGTALRVKGGRPGIPDTWKPAAGSADPAPPADASGTGSTAADGQPAAVDSAADDGQPAPAPSSGPPKEGNRKPPASRTRTRTVTAEASGNVLAVSQAADEAGKALAAGDLPATLAALDAVREQAALGWRALKTAASGRHAPTTRPGALRDLVEEHLRTFPDAAFTPHQIGKVLTRSAGAVANALDKLVGLGTAELASDKPRSYLAPAPAPDAVGDPSTSAEAAPSAVSRHAPACGPGRQDAPWPVCCWASLAIGRKLKGFSVAAMGVLRTAVVDADRVASMEYRFTRNLLQLVFAVQAGSDPVIARILYSEAVVGLTAILQNRQNC